MDALALVPALPPQFGLGFWLLALGAALAFGIAFAWSMWDLLRGDHDALERRGPRVP